MKQCNVYYTGFILLTLYICLISSLCSLLEQFLSHFLVLPRASDFCSLFVSLPSEMNLFYPELIYLPSARNWTQLLRVIGSTLRTFHKKVRKFETIHRKGKVTFKAIIDETSFWESPPLTSNCSSPLFNFPNYIEVKSKWSWELKRLWNCNLMLNQTAQDIFHRVKGICDSSVDFPWKSHFQSKSEKAVKQQIELFLKLVWCL